MKKYRNKTTGAIYTEGNYLRVNINEETSWHGIPTEEQLAEYGFEEIIIPQPTEREIRMRQIKAQLASMDYLTSKYIDGEDMTEYGDWQSKRKSLREEYRELEQENNN